MASSPILDKNNNNNNNNSNNNSSNNDHSFCIKRTDKHTNILFSSFRELFEDELLFDCSLVCEGKIIRGHRFLLAAASPYFRAAINSFTDQRCHNMAIIVPEVPYDDLKAIIDFLYRGQVIIDDKQVVSLQKSVETLKVTCLLSSSSTSLSSSLSSSSSSSSSSSTQSVCKLSPPLPSILSKTPKNCTTTIQTTSLSSSSSSAINGGNGLGRINHGNSIAGGHDRSSPAFASPSSINNLHNGSSSPFLSHNHIQRHPFLYPNFFSNSKSPSHMLKVITPPTGPAKVIYQPHEPFVQLRELLKRGPNSSSKHLSQVSSQSQKQSQNQLLHHHHLIHHQHPHHAGLINDNPVDSSSNVCDLGVDSDADKDGYFSGDDMDIDLIHKSKNDPSVALDSDLDENDADSEDDEDDLADDGNNSASGGVDYPSDQQIIDMSINSNNLQRKSRHDDDLDVNLSINYDHCERENNSSNNSNNPKNSMASIDDNPHNETIDIDTSDKLLSPLSNNISNSSASNYSNLPLSVTIASSFNSATARAIAASTTLAVASGLLSNSEDSDHHHHHHHLHHHSHHNQHGHHQQSHSNQAQFDGDGQQLLPLKRGRGRPPRHLREEETNFPKTYKVRPILPSASSDISPPPGIIISSEPTINPLIKRKKISLDTLLALKGRRQKLSSSSLNNANSPASPSTSSASTNNNNAEQTTNNINNSSNNNNGNNCKNICPYCPQVYYSNQAMNDHINNVHTGNAIKYTCDICSKEFSWKISLTKHLRNTHKQDKHDIDSSQQQSSNNQVNNLNERKAMFINY